MRRSEAEIRADYADLLGDSEDPALLRVITNLDAGLRGVELPPELAVPRRPLSRASRPLTTNPSRRWNALLRGVPVPVMALLLVILASGAALAVANITNLGRPTNATLSSPMPAVGAFHRIGTTLRQNGKPELLFIGTMVDEQSAAERWPVVKALEQFGTLSNVTPATSHNCWFQPYSQALQCSPPILAAYPQNDATFDWDRARYRSRYLAFVHRDLIDQQLRVHKLPTPRELALFNRYVRVPGYAKWQDAVWKTAIVPGSTQSFPLVVIGDYLETGANTAIPGDLRETQTTRILSLSFSTIQRSLASGKATGGAPRSLITDYNAEANIITALICHADGSRPKSACERPVIRSILRHVK